MGILDQYLEDYYKAAQRHNSDVGDYNETIKRYNSSLQMGPDGKPIVVINSKPQNSVSNPRYGGTPFSGNKMLEFMGNSDTEADIVGNPAAQWGVGGKVYYTDYRMDQYSGQQQGGRDYYYIARKPENIKTGDDNRQFFEKRDGGYDTAPYYTLGDDTKTRYTARTDENGNITGFITGGENSPTEIVAKSLGDGRYYTGGFSVSHDGLPAKPGDYTGRPAPKRPDFTMAQQQQLGQPDEAQAMSNQMKDGNGIIARLLERKDEQD